MIRKITLDEYEETCKLIYAVDYVSTLKHDIKKGLVFGLFLKKVLVGVCRIAIHKYYIQVVDIVVKQPYRHKGYGKALLKYAEDMCKKTKAKVIRVYTHSSFKSYTFYCKCRYIMTNIYLGDFVFEKSFK